MGLGLSPLAARATWIGLDSLESGQAVKKRKAHNAPTRMGNGFSVAQIFTVVPGCRCRQPDRVINVQLFPMWRCLSRDWSRWRAARMHKRGQHIREVLHRSALPLFLPGGFQFVALSHGSRCSSRSLAFFLSFSLALSLSLFLSLSLSVSLSSLFLSFCVLNYPAQLVSPTLKCRI